MAGALGAAASKLGGLTTLASAGLSVGAIAQLQSAIASLSSGGPAAINLPTVGFNTNDRASITAQTTTLLGDPGIPPPNLTGAVPTEAVSTYESHKAANDALSNEFKKITDEFITLTNASLAAHGAFTEANNTYPAGDPAIAAAYDKWKAAQAAAIVVRDKGLAFQKAHPEFA